MILTKNKLILCFRTSKDYKKKNKKRLGIYYPIKCEINIFSVIANTYLNCNIMLPSLKKNNGKMIFRKWDRTQPLCLGKFGIPEPHSNHISLEPDILIVPLLAFDKNKNRVWLWWWLL